MIGPGLIAGAPAAKSGGTSGTRRRESIVKPPKTMSEGQRAYEAKRAAKAGMSLDKYLAAKERDRLAEEKAKLKAAEPPKPPKPPGFFGRLLERAQRPLRGGS